MDSIGSAGNFAILRRGSTDGDFRGEASPSDGDISFMKSEIGATMATLTVRRILWFWAAACGLGWGMFSAATEVPSALIAEQPASEFPAP